MAGKRATPSVGIIDSQSVKTTQKGGQRLRCWKEDKRQEAPYYSGYVGVWSQRVMVWIKYK